MAEHNDLGQLGEDLAVAWLKNHGFEILERNWRGRNEEIDVIARKDNQLIIVEVKTRKTRAFGNPENSVSLSKQRNLVNAAELYIKKKNSHLETRFDILSVIANSKGHDIEHIPNAFSPFD